VLAVPVASAEALATLTPLVDEVICLYRPEYFYAVGAHYEQFQQVDDDAVIALIQSLRAPKP
jgi:predicted phosphoribosyltransferase